MNAPITKDSKADRPGWVLGSSPVAPSRPAGALTPASPTINLYGGASGLGFDKVIADCNKQADGKYKIVGNLLPATPTVSASSSSGVSPPRTTAWT